MIADVFGKKQNACYQRMQ